MNEPGNASLRSPTGTIGHGHYLQVMRRCDQISARIDQLAAMFSAGDEHRLRQESQISELLSGLQQADQQCLDRVRRHDHLHSRLEQLDRRLYAMQQEILSRTTTIASPAPAATPEADTDISDSEIGSDSFPSSSSGNDVTSSPAPCRSFSRSQGLDANADPFEMPPVQMPPIDNRVEQRTTEFERFRTDFAVSARPIARQHDRQNRGRRPMAPMRCERQQFGSRRGPPPGFAQHTSSSTQRSSSDNSIKQVSAMYKELGISGIQHDPRRRPLPGQPRSAARHPTH